MFRSFTLLTAARRWLQKRRLWTCSGAVVGLAATIVYARARATTANDQNRKNGLQEAPRTAPLRTGQGCVVVLCHPRVEQVAVVSDAALKMVRLKSGDSLAPGARVEAELLAPLSEQLHGSLEQMTVSAGGAGFNTARTLRWLLSALPPLLAVQHRIIASMQQQQQQQPAPINKDVRIVYAGAAGPTDERLSDVFVSALEEAGIESQVKRTDNRKVADTSGAEVCNGKGIRQATILQSQSEQRKKAVVVSSGGTALALSAHDLTQLLRDLGLASATPPHSGTQERPDAATRLFCRTSPNRVVYISGWALRAIGPETIVEACKLVSPDVVLMLNLSAEFLVRGENARKLKQVLPFCDVVYGNEAIKKDSPGSKRDDERGEGSSVLLEFPVPSLSPSTVHDFTGTDDAHVAGFLAGLVLGYSLEQCVQLGTFAAQHTLQRNGADPGREPARPPPLVSWLEYDM